jgi:glycosyltransferase involved in cell wall biosynthesis
LNTALLKAMALRAERRSFRRGAAAAVVAERGVAEIERFYPGTQVVLTENAVPDVAPTTTRLATRAALGFDEETLVLLVGGDWALRGVPLVVEALGTLPKGVHLLLVGDGDRTLVEAAAARAGVLGRVHLLGQRRDLADLYAAADLLVQASAYETFSLVLVEAARAHLPIVSTDVGVASTLYRGGPGDRGDGLVLVDREPAAIASGIARVLGDPAAAAARAERAAARSRRFDDAHLIHAVDEAYRGRIDA